MIISSAGQTDEGRYQCIARNMAGVRHSTQALLSVYGESFVLFIISLKETIYKKMMLFFCQLPLIW